MRNLKAVGLLVLAVIAGLGAAIYAAGWVSQRANLALGKVVVAAVDIEMGTKVSPQMLTVVDWPQASKPDGVFTDIKDVQDRVVKVGMLRGEALVDRKLAPPGTQGGLSAVIAEGKRAMTVRVNDVVGVAGFALPGNYVDVMIHAQQDRAKGEASTPISVTVLEQVLVLAVAQEAGRDDTKPKVVSAVTLEVTPAQAEKLDLARSVGQLSLVLRNQLDKLPVNTVGVTKDDLLKFKPVEAVKLGGPPAPQPVRYVQRPVLKGPGTCVEVIRSGTRANECF